MRLTCRVYRSSCNLLAQRTRSQPPTRREPHLPMLFGGRGYHRIATTNRSRLQAPQVARSAAAARWWAESGSSVDQGALVRRRAATAEFSSGAGIPLAAAHWQPTTTGSLTPHIGRTAALSDPGPVVIADQPEQLSNEHQQRQVSRPVCSEGAASPSAAAADSALDSAVQAPPPYHPTSEQRRQLDGFVAYLLQENEKHNLTGGWEVLECGDVNICQG